MIIIKKKKKKEIEEKTDRDKKKDGYNSAQKEKCFIILIKNKEIRMNNTHTHKHIYSLGFFLCTS